MMNLFQPSVQLQRKVRVGARLRRRYDAPQTPLDRLRTFRGGATVKRDALHQLRARLDPFALAEAIERQLRQLAQLAHRGPIRGARHPLPHQRFEIHRLPTRNALSAVGPR